MMFGFSQAVVCDGRLTDGFSGDHRPAADWLTGPVTGCTA